MDGGGPNTGKGKAKMFPKKRVPRRGGGERGYQGNRPRREFSNQTSSAGAQLVNSSFKHPMYQILEKIKNEPYFK